MASEKMKAGPVAPGTDLRNNNLRSAISSGNSLSAFSAQHLADVFAAELVFGGWRRGFRTEQIASYLRMPESLIANRLVSLRDQVAA